MDIAIDLDPIRAEWRARENARETRVKNQLVAKLKENNVVSDEQMMQFKREVVCGDDNTNVRDTRRRQREIEKKFDEENYGLFIKAVVKYIKDHVPNDRCAQVYEDVVSIIPSDSSRPPRQTVSTSEKPETPFSVSQCEPESAKSNAELIDILVSTANLESSQAVSIRGHVTWFDSMSEDGNGGMWDMGTGLIRGGRLGRDHTLDDVPNHYVRDRLMNYILTQLDESKREETKKAVFSDLSAAELEQYSAIIMQKQREIDLKEQTEWEESRRRYLKKQAQKASEAANAERLESLIDEVDTSIDLTPRPGFHFRDYFRLPENSNSAIKPRTFDGSIIDVGTDIDKDCDQVRAMIARFIKESEWSCDQFRSALRHTTRPQLITFLKQKGPEAGKQTNVFQLAWEFFKKREMLGYPFENTSNNTGVLRERDNNRRSERPSPVEGGENRRKRARRS